MEAGFKTLLSAIFEVPHEWVSSSEVENFLRSTLAEYDPKNFVSLRLGLSGEKPKTWKQVAEAVNSSEKNVKRSYGWRMRGLRSPKVLKPLAEKLLAAGEVLPELLSIYEVLSGSVRDWPIEYLMLQTITINPLKNAGIMTVGQLADLSGVELLRVPAFGYKGLNEVYEALQRHDISGQSCPCCGQLLPVSA